MSFNSRYITFPFVTDARDLMQRGFDYMKSKFPGWEPSEGNLDVALIEAFADQANDIATLASEVPKSIFRYFGQTLFKIPPIDAQPATVPSTWFLTDSLGHTIPAGTQVGIRNSGNELIPFVVLLDVIVPGGDTQTTIGEVTLIAITAGLQGTDLGSVGGNVELIDTIDWIDHITQTVPTTGGIDGESDDDYLDRLSLELQTVSPRPILPEDFSILARNVAGVQRAVTLDEYDPGTNTYGNERMVTVIAVDVAGQPVVAGVKTALSDYLESLREVNFVVNTMDAALHEIDVTAHVAILPGYGSSDVAARVNTAVLDYLNPAVWGISSDDNPNDPKTWNNLTIIRYNELVSLLGNLAGVDYVSLLTIGAHGGAQAAADYNIPGIVPLPFTASSDITVVAS